MIFDDIARYGVVPVIALDDAVAALPLADALLEGGLPVAEITFRTPAAQQTIAAIARHRPDVLVGAGSRARWMTHSRRARDLPCRRGLMRRCLPMRRPSGCPSRRGS